MCGIVGYIGKKSAAPILLNGLKRLEYRGYDSAGISVIVDSRIEQVKAKGKLSVLSEILENKPVMSNMGIAHTRWATHGAPSNQNSHPHSDCRNEFSLVHNGIIENYLELKKELEEKGHRFKSETDTEVLVHLIEELYNGDLVQAVIDTLKRVEGSYGIGVISSKEPDKIIAARQDSPLVIGRSDNGNFIGSDIPAFLHFTRYVQHIKDREIVIITGDDVKIMDFDRNQVQRPITKVLWNAGMAQKSGFKHFMLKEIFEQPKVINDVLKGRLSGNGVEIEEFHISDQEINKLNKIVITACGTAYYAGMIGKYFIEEFTRIPVEIDVASELRYRNPVIDENTLMIAISQSGETADTLASFRAAIDSGAHALAITNVVGSSITRETNNIIYTRAGLEIGVAATKTFVAQILALLLFTLKVGLVRKAITTEQFNEIKKEMEQLPDMLDRVLENYEAIRNIARKYYKCEDFLFLGRNISFPIALEGALKLKEISYIHAEGYAAGEMKHGPIALIDGNTPVISVLPQGPVYEKILSNVQEAKARNAVTIGIINDTDESIGEYLDDIIAIPHTNHYLSPILSVIPLQLLAYFIADKKGRDVDQPRNLAKSVTVE